MNKPSGELAQQAKVTCGLSFLINVTNRGAAVFRRIDDEPSQPEDALAALSDTVLLRRISHGDAAAFDALFYRHYDRVYGLLFRLLGDRAEAEDVTQEVFIKLHGHGKAGRVVPDDENVSAWLYRVAMNLGYNALRGRNRLWRRNLHLVPEDEADVEGQVGQSETRTAVRAALHRLPERQSQLLLLRQMGFSYAECAAICNVTPGSVGTLLARAAEAFRREFMAVTGQTGERE
jgi:RNA polymerase sigma-70 factor (ECF subfamily)